MRAMRVKDRSRRRGAVFVEALVVISAFVVFFIGIIYFRELYLGKLASQRLARAGALAHAMGACKSDVGVTLKADLPKGQTVKQSAAKDAPSSSDARGPDDSTKAGNVYGKVAGKRGGTVLNEVDAVEISGSVAVTTKPDPRGPETGFRGTIITGSYVSCGDELTTDQYSAIAKEVPSLLGIEF